MANNFIASLTARIIADAAPFQKGVDQAKGVMNNGAAAIARDADRMAQQTEQAAKRMTTGLAGIKTPTLDPLKAPAVQMPKVGAPNVPALPAPKVGVANIPTPAMPKVPALPAPAVGTPNVPAPKMPSVPGLKVPRIVADAGKAPAVKDMAKQLGGQIDDMTKRAGVGNQKFIQTVGKVPEEFQKQARRLASTMKREYPDLAKLAEAEGRKLVKVMEDGTVKALTRSAGGKLSYRALDQIKGPMDSLGKGPKIPGISDTMKERRPDFQGRLLAGGDLMTRGIARVGGMAGGAIAGVAASTAMAGLAGLVGIMGAAGAAFLTMRKGVSDIMAVDMQSRRLGVSVTELRTLMYAAGPAADAMAGAIEHFGLRLAEARHGSIDAGRDFQRLAALSGKGFGKDFGDLTTAVGFRQMVERLALIPNATQRAAMAFDLLGDRAAEMLPELSKGVAGLDKAQDVMKKFGLGLGDKDLASVRLVSQAMRDIDTLKSGAINQFTLGLAPIVAELSKVFDVTKLDISGWQNGIVSAAEAVAKAGAFVVDNWGKWDNLWSALEVGWLRFTATVMEGIAEILQVLPSLGKEIGNAFGVSGDVADAIGSLMGSSVGFSAISDLQRRLGARIGAADQGGIAADLSDRAGLKKTQADQVWAALQASQDAMRQAGQLKAGDAVDAFFERVRKGIGGVQTSLAGMEPPAWIKNANQAFAGMQSSINSPLEIFKQAMQQIKDMEKLGKFAGAPDLKLRFTQKAFGDLQSAVPLPQYQGTGAALANTKESYSAILQHQFQSQRMTVQQQMKQILEEANRLQKENLRIGRDVLDEIRRGGLEVKGL